MKVSRIQNNINFMKNSAPENKKNRREFIDVFTDAIKNQRDVDDCIAVPRGIFKAYLLIMAGTGLIAIANLIPAQTKRHSFGKTKTAMSITGWILNILSAWFFAKGFAVKGMSKTINRDEYKFNH